MILERFHDEPLAQTSYLVGCAATGEAVVVDPIRDITPYLESARAHGLRITHVAETHIHADFVSGSRELHSRTGARLFLSAEGGPDWSYRFVESDGAVLLTDGDRFDVGEVRFEAVHTPGHTPEHLTFLVTDRAGADRPMGAFTGDFVFVGDVGRPDLLERAARIEGTMEAGARDLFKSLERFERLPDWLQIWPAHGAGSACGKSLGAVPSSTLGYERRFNWGFSHSNEDEFVEALLSGQPEPPLYFAHMKAVNRDGPQVLGDLAGLPVRSADELSALLEREEVTVVDTRSASAFADGHIPGTMSVPLGQTFTTNAGWVLSYDHDLHLVAADTVSARRAARNLRTIGFDRLEGISLPQTITEWAKGERALQTVEQVPTETLDRLLATGKGKVQVVDVRRQNEWNAGHIPGATHLPMGYLRDRLEEIGPGRPLVVHCATGVRAGIAASMLQARGFEGVASLEGGFDAWRAEERSIERPGEPEPAEV